MTLGTHSHLWGHTLRGGSLEGWMPSPAGKLGGASTCCNLGGLEDT